MTLVKIYAQLDAPGVTVQICHYNWYAGDHISAYNHDFVITYRPYPKSVEIVAQLPGGARQSFGQLMFFPALLEIEAGIAKKSGSTRIVCCRFNSEWLHRIWGSMPAWTDQQLASCLDMQNVVVEQALQQLGSEVVRPNGASGLLINSLSTTIAIEIARHLATPGSQVQIRAHDGRFCEADMLRIDDFIISIEHRRPSIEEIARFCNIGSAHLARVFKKNTGTTVFKYVDTICFKKAQRLLVETDLSIKEIGLRLGFSSVATFSTTFKRWSSKTPSGYRFYHKSASY